MLQLTGTNAQTPKSRSVREITSPRRCRAGYATIICPQLAMALRSSLLYALRAGMTGKPWGALRAMSSGKSGSGGDGEKGGEEEGGAATGGSEQVKDEAGLEELPKDDELDEMLEWRGEGRDPLEVVTDPEVPGLPPLEDILREQEDGGRSGGRREKGYQEPPKMKFKEAPEVDKHGRAYGTGRRKTSVARVWAFHSDEHTFLVNGKELDDQFSLWHDRKTCLEPLLLLGQVGNVGVRCTVRGGGRSGKAQAVRHGLSRAMECLEPLSREPLRRNGLLTRDPRMKERKKPGKPKARRSPQWVKR